VPAGAGEADDAETEKAWGVKDAAAFDSVRDGMVMQVAMPGWRSSRAISFWTSKGSRFEADSDSSAARIKLMPEPIGAFDATQSIAGRRGTCGSWP
jgi:hypothetical protein